MSIAQFKLSLNVKIYFKLRFRAETRIYLFGGLELNWVKKIENILVVRKWGVLSQSVLNDP